MSPNKSKRSLSACRSWQTSVAEGDSQPPTTAKAPAKPPNNAKEIAYADVLALTVVRRQWYHSNVKAI